MRRVAQKLGVNPTSLYNHVSDRAAMVEDVRALVSARIDSAPLRELPWEDGLVAWARSLPVGLRAASPCGAPADDDTSSAPVLMAEYEDFAVAAEAVGWASAEVLPLLTAFESFISAACSKCRGERCHQLRTGRVLSALGRRRRDANDQYPNDPIATRAFERGVAMLGALARPPRRRSRPKRRGDVRCGQTVARTGPPQKDGSHVSADPSAAAPHDRTWTGLPVGGRHNGHTAAAREECHAAWTDVEMQTSNLKVRMVADPTEIERERPNCPTRRSSSRCR